MTQIGQFTRTKSGYTGYIHTLTLDRELTLVPTESSDAENAPDYRVHHGDGSGIEVGAAWKRSGEKAGDYLSLQLDDPTFDRPIRANLFQLEAESDTWTLRWNRPPKSGDKD
ncbi:uncharacterized protein (DUF736 family) [Rhodobium orientis]|uniref:DUF736 domain-containing protein n=1 Tax=Rhodobium orientis TaxID=34017 RepID=A0A327JNL7_9HYPH|nr:DUF736 domain-containing protein [Rhodobium orientis]MBB4303141.1 uncharacterized protein (DUF736 family) [Rhodobium orientis]MBK5951757.1 hypothetical protein [Rhodobium orientis]RAI26934.1 hypothetical protein CH339_12160 [Rhodobium orientis]